ncbi:MAG: hypothetical protein QW815_08275, partial [Nitrososphaerota archaeon]
MEPVEIALRCHVEPDPGLVRERSGRKSNLREWRRPDLLLVLDVETTTDYTQALTFGTVRLFIRQGDLWVQTDEYLFYDPDLREKDLLALRRWVEAHTERIANRDYLVGSSPPVEFHFLPLHQFRKVLFKLAYDGEAMIIGFNLKFDLSRIAQEATPSRTRKYANGFAFRLFTYRDRRGKIRPSRFRPPIYVKHVDKNKYFIGFGKSASSEGEAHSDRGNFLDLKTLIHAITGKSHTLESACEEFGVANGKIKVAHHGEVTPEYIEYNRRDVQLTFELYTKAIAEYDRYAISPVNRNSAFTLPEVRAYSPASIAKATYRNLGIQPPMEKNQHIPPEILGVVASSFYGGRAEANFRGIAPVVYVDFFSMYPTVFALMEFGRYLFAERIEIEDATEQTRKFLERVDAEEMMKPMNWKDLFVVVQIQPEGDLLPVRGRFRGDDDTYNISEAYLYSDFPLYYPLPILVASKIRTGKTPRILKAIRFTPQGLQKGLIPGRIYGTVEFDPHSGDIARFVIEERFKVKKGLPPYDKLEAGERKRTEHALKIFANAAFYGIFMEVNRQEIPGNRKKVPVRVFPGVGEDYETTAPAWEVGGAFYFPLFATMITSAARLMLTLLEKQVTDAGGSWAFCDTDSMAIISTKTGGPFEILSRGADGKLYPRTIHTLSWEEIQEIAERFQSLNPYDRSVVQSSILKIEEENFRNGTQVQLYALTLSAKRYALFELDSQANPLIRKASMHGLGSLADPLHPDKTEQEEESIGCPAWILEIWKYLIKRELGERAELPEWVNLPAIRVRTISTPPLMKPFRKFNKGKPYSQQIKPFSFMNVATPVPWAKPSEQFLLVAPFEPDPRRWTEMDWFDFHSGRSFRISTTWNASPGVCEVKTYRFFIEAFYHHPEEKRMGPDGLPCDCETRGLLTYRVVRPLSKPTNIGKEGNNLEM